MNLGNTATVLSGAKSYLVVTTNGVYAFNDVQGMRNAEFGMWNAEWKGARRSQDIGNK